MTPLFFSKRKMAFMVECLLAACFCNAIARFIHTECFLPLGSKPDAHVAAGQFEALSSRPSRKCVFLVSVKGHVQIMRWLVFHDSLYWNEVLRGASYGGHLQFVYLTMNKGATDWMNGLYEACRGGHRKVAEFMISKGAAHWGWGLRGACEGGHHNVAEWMISKGANNWNRGLYYARKSGHAHMARLMIQKGATKCSACCKPISEHV
jgi:hypothetical protein